LSALGDPNPLKVQIPTIEQLKNILLLDLVNKELMRIMTTVSAFLKKSTTISTLIHHNPNDFPDPYKFKLERFADNSNEESRNWQPFGNGPRKCIGSTFALLEQRVTLSICYRSLNFVLARIIQITIS
ncbi:cytochrome P450, partial [Conidiobolus coronatus NRRL 28638]